MTNETHTYQHTVSELMAQQGITITALAKRAGIAYSTAKRAVDGGIFANNVSSAHRIAAVLGVMPNEVRWIKEPSTCGKEAGFGTTTKSVAKPKVCPRCHTAVPSGTGICEDDGIRGV
jgi:lambda repressor-like predicted transcriptional regulator